MMNRIELFLCIVPQNYERLRHDLRYKRSSSLGREPYIHRHSTAEYDDYKKRLAGMALVWLQVQEASIQRRLPFTLPIAVGMEFYLPREKRRGGKIVHYRDEYPTALCDLDNYEKAVQDALEKILWRNDKIICRRLPGGKCFADNHHSVGIRIVIEPLAEEDERQEK